MFRPLIVGLGEVGKELFEVVRGVYPAAQFLDVDDKEIKGRISVMHICFGHSEHFIRDVVSYQKRFKPTLTIIESTVLPTTTDTIFEETKMKIVHSPVRGSIKMGSWKWSLFNFTKYVGGVTPESTKLAIDYYKSLGFKTAEASSPLQTEFMKIINTTYFGLLISWFQEIERIAKMYNLNMREIRDFFTSFERDSGYTQPRPVYYGDFIGGKCVIPNAHLLYRAFPSKFIQTIFYSNRKKQEELKNELAGENGSE